MWKRDGGGGGAEEEEGSSVREGAKSGGEGLERTRQTRRIHSGERCLCAGVNPLQGLVSCQTS